MYDATKLQDDERLSGKKRDGIAGVIMSISTVSKHFFCSGTYRVGLNTGCTFPSSSVDLSTIRVSDGNVFQQIAVDVYGANV